MKIFVHSRARTLKRDYYWVELLNDGTTRVVASRTPHAAYDELLNLIDGTSPSIILAQSAAGELLLLVKGLASERLDGSSPRRTIYNALLLVFVLAEEAHARAFAAALLRPSPTGYSAGGDGFNSDVVRSLNAFISDGPSFDTYEVLPALRDRVEELIGGAGSLDRARCAPLSGTLGARNSPRFRQSLSEELTRNALPVEGMARKLRPFVVVTGEQDGESLVSAGASRMLTDQIRHEDDWYDFLGALDGVPARARAGGAPPPHVIRDPELATSPPPLRAAGSYDRVEFQDERREPRVEAARGDVKEEPARRGPGFLQWVKRLIRSIFLGGGGNTHDAEGDTRPH